MSKVLFKNCLERWIIFLEEKNKILDSSLIEEDKEDLVNSIKSEKIKIERQLEILRNVKNGIVCCPNLFLDLINFDDSKNERIIDSEALFFNKNLNKSQEQAVKNAINSTKSLTVIQGPPGTGKTTVITEICQQLYWRNENVRILIASETHVAVNNVLENLKEFYSDYQILRVGNKEDGLEYFQPSDIVNSSIKYLRERGSIDQDVAKNLFYIFSDENRSKTLEVDLINSINFVGMTCNKCSFRLKVGLVMLRF